jgi:hypothetical protein
MRRIGALMVFAAGDQEVKAWLNAPGDRLARTRNVWPPATRPSSPPGSMKRQSFQNPLNRSG